MSAHQQVSDYCQQYSDVELAQGNSLTSSVSSVTSSKAYTCLGDVGEDVAITYEMRRMGRGAETQASPA